MIFDKLMKSFEWRAIRNCPGRYVFSQGPSRLTPGQLAGIDGRLQEFRVPAARDTIEVIAFEGGGLLSYRKPDGSYLHTLNTTEGLRRKLDQLGIFTDVKTDF